MSQLSEFMNGYKQPEGCGWTYTADGEFAFSHAVPEERVGSELPPIDEGGLAVNGAAVASHYDSAAIAQTLRANHQQLLTLG